MEMDTMIVGLIVFQSAAVMIVGIAAFLTAHYKSRTIDALLARVKRLESRQAGE
ncbi:hypothetical protein GR138_12910 [Shinella kummerowiae]|uniref:Uncharacterized protein n=1 Tax=Shinella kummerowiae TaxID=417745 RepID=A0A6N8SBN4_9HYPH|nr:hypothetical protein [Shinella kummerowiae]MXN46091.1 hypothetical protein [Shinella kummerowiae]